KKNRQLHPTSSCTVATCSGSADGMKEGREAAGSFPAKVVVTAEEQRCKTPVSLPDCRRALLHAANWGERVIHRAGEGCSTGSVCRHRRFAVRFLTNWRFGLLDATSVAPPSTIAEQRTLPRFSEEIRT